ncbi:MAG TPA: thiamine pyrophosphate-requiring protein [Solirubrobacteraceae bacterium]|nr:thiamine pyrophosphate-requiring protein [Solirubrobacteraceae bacterium]
MSQTVSDHLLDRLRQWGVRQVFGFPGDGINGLLAAWGRAGNDPQFVQSRHEEMSAFEAVGFAKFSGTFGVCAATSGPGAIHLLNGLYDAKLDHVPVLAIVGQQPSTALGASYQQEVDLRTLFKDVASEYLQEIIAPTQAQHVVDRAVQVARTTRSVTTMIIPNDVQEADYAEPPRTHGSTYSGGAIRRPRVIPTDAELRRAADVLNAGAKPAILVGAGARGAYEEIEQLADVLGCGVARALNGRDVVPDDAPWVTGSIGLLGTKPSDEMMESCDTLLMIGTSFPYSEWLPKPGQARGVQIDLDATRLGIRYPMEVNLCGDARETLVALLELLERKADRSWREHLEEEIARWWEIVEADAMHDANPLNPQRVLWELSSRLPDGAMVLADSGSSTNWFARQLRLRRGMRAALSGTLATMGPAMPYAVAAKFAYPDRVAVAIEGDGSMQMNGINSLIDAARYHDRWSDPRLVCCVLHNNDLNQVTWEQRVMEGDPKLEVSQDLPDFPYARYAELLGLGAVRVDDPDAVGPAWDAAMAADRPFLIEAITDPEVPPLPPHIRFEQAKGFATSLAKGGSDRGEMIKQSIKGKLEEFTNR